MNAPETKSPAAAFLASLPGDSFLPSEARVAELNAASGLELPVTPVALADCTTSIGEEIAAFAAEFWELSPTERQARFAELSAKKPAWPVSTRLEALEPGLEIAMVAQWESNADELARLIRDLFVLPPRTRAVRRAAWLMEHGKSRQIWNLAAKSIQADQPGLMELEPTLFGWLTPGAAKLTPVPSDTIVHDEEIVRQESVTLPSYVGETAARSNSAGAKGGVGCVIAVVIIIIRMIAGGSSSSRNQSTTDPNYKYQSPMYPDRSRDGTFTPPQVDSYRMYESDLMRKQPLMTKPAGYDQWVRYGRPPANDRKW